VLLARKAFPPAQQWGVPAHTSISLGTGSLHKEGSIFVVEHPPLFYSFSSWGVNLFMTVLDIVPVVSQKDLPDLVE